MFNLHLSYSELSSALYQAAEDNRLLTKNEIDCLNSSLQDVLLSELLSLYPLPKKSEKLVTDSVNALHINQEHSETELNIHSSLYGGTREKTARFLEKNYPIQSCVAIIKKLETFLKNFIHTPDAEQALILSEQERYHIRLRMHKLKTLSEIEPLHDLDEIKSDFIDYLSHLEGQKILGSTYGWHTLASIFLRLDNAELSPTLKEESKLLLLRALDDSRTAYHDKSKKFITGKNYTCQKGFAERLLDHFYAIVPSNSNSLPLASKTILSLTEPFILRTPGMYEEGCKVTYSESLYQLYLDCAGYKMINTQRNIQKMSENICLDALTQEFLLSIGPVSQIMLMKAQYDFKSTIAIINKNLLLAEDRRYPEVVKFLKEKNLLKLEIVTELELKAPESAKEEKDIRSAMLQKGPFIDNAHLELILALHDNSASLKTLEESARAGTEISLSHEPPSRHELLSTYHAYLLETGESFLHFFDESLLHENLHQKIAQSIRLTQTALCQYLDRFIGELSPLQCEKIAALCCKVGYKHALEILCHKINLEYIDADEGLSLIHFAALNGHHEVVLTLLEAGLNPNILGRELLSPIQIASVHGHSLVVEVLMRFQADINFQEPANSYTALHLAAEAGFSQVINRLLGAGAIIDLQTGNRETALHIAIRCNHLPTVKVLLKAGAHPNLQGGLKQQTPLYIATSKCRTAMIKPLLDAGALPDIPHGRWLKAAIHNAATLGHEEIVRALLDGGANPNLPDKWRNTPLSIALDQGHFQVAKTLLLAGATLHTHPLSFHAQSTKAHFDINSLISEENTPNSNMNKLKQKLHVAICHDDLSGVIECLDAGVNINNLKNGRCALDIAIDYKNPNIIKVLVNSPSMNPHIFTQVLQRAICEPCYHEIVPHLLRKDLIDIFIKNHPNHNLSKWAENRRCWAAAEAFKAPIRKVELTETHAPIIYSQKQISPLVSVTEAQKNSR